MDNLVGKVSDKRNTDLVEVISEYRACDVVVGGRIFISAEDAKVILSSTKMVDRNVSMDACTMTKVHEDDLQMLFQCRDLVRQFAKGILYTPATESSMDNLLNKYI